MSSLDSPMAVAGLNRKIPQIPQDLYYRIIISNFTLTSNSWDYHTDIHNLTSVSKAWRYEAERIIYVRVSVRNRNLLLFCRTVIDRPDLAKRVRVLKFCSAGNHARRPGELETVKRMFSLVINLKDLEFRSECRGYDWDVKGDLICQHRDWDVFMDVPFKLDRLACSFYWDEDLMRILEQQPALRQFESLNNARWSKDWVHAGPFVPEAVLANCKALRMCPYMTHTFTRLPPVTHLRLELANRPPIEEAHGAEEVALFGDSLRVLAIRRRMYRLGDVDYLAPAQIVKKFAGKTQKLSVLGMFDDFVWSPKDNKEVLQALVDHFPSLKAFIWAPCSSFIKFQETEEWESSEYDGYSSCSDEEMTEYDKIEEFAFVCMDAIPTLTFFIADGRRRENIAFERLWTEDGEWYLEPRRYVVDGPGSFSYIDPEYPFDVMGSSFLYDGRFDLL